MSAACISTHEHFEVGLGIVKRLLNCTDGQIADSLWYVYYFVWFALIVLLLCVLLLSISFAVYVWKEVKKKQN
jgi:hypothetical protein